MLSKDGIVSSRVAGSLFRMMKTLQRMVLDSLDFTLLSRAINFLDFCSFHHLMTFMSVFLSVLSSTRKLEKSFSWYKTVDAATKYV